MQWLPYRILIFNQLTLVIWKITIKIYKKKRDFYGNLSRELVLFTENQALLDGRLQTTLLIYLVETLAVCLRLTLLWRLILPNLSSILWTIIESVRSSLQPILSLFVGALCPGLWTTQLSDKGQTRKNKPYGPSSALSTVACVCGIDDRCVNIQATK